MESASQSARRWAFPEDGMASSTSTDAHFSTSSSAAAGRSWNSQPDGQDTAPPRPQRRHRPRTCRICLETVEPTFEDAQGGPMAFLGPKPKVRYISEDPEYGRLISPCKCKGSQKYVHEGCLQAWRQSQPLEERNYWKCPTCGFRYKMERLNWARWVSNAGTRVSVTILVFISAVFILGFVGDPLIDMWLDPVGLIREAVADQFGDVEILGDPADEPRGWFDHFFTGFLSLGVLGFLKTLLAMSPWHWLNLRVGGGGRRRGGGRDRLETINWVFVIVGVFTFLAAVWKGINMLCARVLEKAGDRIIDVQADGDDDDEEEEQEGPAGEQPEARKDI